MKTFDFKIKPVQIKSGIITCLQCPNAVILDKTKDGDIRFKCIESPDKIRVVPMKYNECEIVNPKTENKKPVNNKQRKKKITKKKYDGAGYIQQIYDRMDKKEKRK